MVSIHKYLASSRRQNCRRRLDSINNLGNLLQTQQSRSKKKLNTSNCLFAFKTLWWGTKLVVWKNTWRRLRRLEHSTSLTKGWKSFPLIWLRWVVGKIVYLRICNLFIGGGEFKKLGPFKQQKLEVCLRILEPLKCWKIWQCPRTNWPLFRKTLGNFQNWKTWIYLSTSSSLFQAPSSNWNI